MTTSDPDDRPPPWGPEPPPSRPEPPPWQADAPAYPPPGSYPPPPYPGPGSSAGRPWTIAGLVCGIVALIFLPIILGPMGAVFGFIGKSKGDPMGQWVGIGSIVATVIGIILSIAVTSAILDDAFLRG